ncbi:MULTISPECIES: carotenoid oxygenase family protein [unclassified Leptolyngbya]|uniref:carotenoid oxygenase family protein n=1 Tax=unclassified Leptolyngbya TaxID=2650499 RepID=UPI0016857AD5|nr:MULTISPECIES: carotenoid oxygenase family protein [unclassified Leptolyngbya]MBD1909537.1 carotenoid oxygenase family protein [Leptolyngbya sp. FACHB-8]MBD2154617.1 carotenoid oxygenase family protein [Leptolyngbya sp. FACHB-16]
METVTPFLSAPKNPYTRDEWRTGYRSLTEELDYTIDEVEGEIPLQLHGTLFRNGPGLLERGGQRYRHPFDGDGMICAIAFKDGKAHFRNRFVRTEGFIAEEKAQKILYRGVFGTQKPGGWLANAFDFRLKNIANTNVIHWGDKLLALWEAAEPHRLDPATLDTLGMEYLDGVLKPGDSFSAHPWIDPVCDRAGGAPRLVNFSIKAGLSTTLTLFELDEAGTVVEQHRHAVPGFAFMHDFAITPNHAIFFQASILFNPLPFAVGMKGAGECLTFQLDKPTNILVVPRDGSPMQIFPTEAGFVFHHANAFEDGEEIVVDSICYGFFPELKPDQDFVDVDFDELAPGQLWRSRINPKTGAVNRQLLEERCCEFPATHPDRVGRSYRMLYMGAAHAPTGNAPLQAILKIDFETGDRQLWSAAPWGYVSEPVFVPFPDSKAEDEGWLLTLVYNGHSERSELVILDARDLSEPVAKLKLKHHVPYGLHGNFTPEYFG